MDTFTNGFEINEHTIITDYNYLQILLKNNLNGTTYTRIVIYPTRRHVYEGEGQRVPYFKFILGRQNCIVLFVHKLCLFYGFF